MSDVHLTLSQAIEGYLLTKHLAFSPATVENYTWALGKFVTNWKCDPLLKEITAHNVNPFLLGLQENLSQTSLLTVHAVLSALWTWATKEGYASKHVVRRVEAPSPEQRAIVPFTRADAHPHHFHHTGTITFLRNGGDVYSLQALLGQPTLEIAQPDVMAIDLALDLWYDVGVFTSPDQMPSRHPTGEQRRKVVGCFLSCERCRYHPTARHGVTLNKGKQKGEAQ